MADCSIIDICKNYNFSLTPLREKVLNLFINSQNSLKAYNIITTINNDRDTKPIVIYRILNLLLKKNIIHKLQSNNTFILCDNKFCYHNDGVVVFLLCNNCHKIIEIENTQLLDNIKILCTEKSFKLTDSNIEINGLCYTCDEKQLGDSVAGILLQK
jgi:Fur family zinc uptake transcriptional regulator